METIIKIMCQKGLKEQIKQRLNFSQRLLIAMLIEKFRSPLNISGASRQNSAAAFSLETQHKNKNVSSQLVQRKQSLQKPWDPRFIWIDIIYSLCLSMN